MLIAVDDTRLWFDVDGAALVADGPAMRERPTLLLLHGGPGADHSVFKPLFQQLAADMQVVFLDQRGQGRSARSEPGRWTLDRWADDVAAFCAVLGIVRPVILGHSFGGFVAMALAARHPDLTGSIVVTGSAARIDRRAVVARFGALGGERAAAAARDLFDRPEDDAVLARFRERCFPLYTRRAPDPAAAARIVPNRALMTHFYAPDGEFGRFDYRADLGRYAGRVLMLHGADDPIVPLAFAEETAAAFGRAAVRLVVYEDAAHHLQVDRPADVLAEVRAFALAAA